MAKEETKKITEYIVVGESAYDAFLSMVKKKIQEGWRLQGGVSTCISANNTFMWSQALVR